MTMTDRPAEAPRPFIVAEVSKNWKNGEEVVPYSGLLAERFEEIINVNAQRGYRLLSFQVHRMMVAKDEMNETIIAVFGLARPRRSDLEGVDAGRMQ